MKTLFTALLLLAAIACSSEEPTSKTQDVQDIDSMTVRSDGQYDVRCRDGRREIRSANEIRRGTVCENGGGGGGGGDDPFICAARDNDGRDPWVLAVLTRNGDVVRVTNASYANNADCRRASDASRPNGGGRLVCLSRDNDGRDPWTGAWVDTTTGASQVISNLSYSNLDACIAGIGDGIAFQDQIIVCTARDNDGRDPWILGRFSRGTFTQQPEVQYGAIDQCQSALSSARRNGGSLLVCGSRDRDGRDPWSLYNFTTAGVTRTTLSYNTLADCLQGR